MGRIGLPPEVAKIYHQWDVEQKYHPMETEQVEGNLRLTKIRRIVPITQHYYSNFNAREQPNR